MAAGTLRLKDGPDHEERTHEPEDLSLKSPANGFTDEDWTLVFECKGSPRGRDVVELVIDRAYITFVNLCVLKDKFGYSMWDYMYYKKRCGTDVASLELIDFEHETRAIIVANELERKVRIIIAKEPLKELSVSITPIKRPRDHQEDLPCV
ncbi:hypothetical protein BS78_01G257500 [Paspalum vaginatum]|nr:hypothetical protein BS78_01G257500 [Paspalum vaginatum]